MKPLAYEAEWEQIVAKFSEDELRAMVRSLVTDQLPRGRVRDILLELTDVLRHKRCSEIARQCGWDKGNFNRWTKNQLFSKLAENEAFFGFVRDRILDFFRHKYPNLLYLNPLQEEIGSEDSIRFLSGQNPVKRIREALSRGDCTILESLSYCQIAPPTGRILASYNDLVIPQRELYLWVTGELTSLKQAKAGVSLALFALGLCCNPDPNRALRMSFKIIEQTGNVAEYDHSLLIGLSYNISLTRYLLDREVFTPLMQASLKKFSSPIEFAQGIADFEMKRGALIDDLLNRLFERLPYLPEKFSGRDRLALFILEVSSLLTMPPKEMEQVWACMYELAELVQRQVDEGRKLFQGSPYGKVLDMLEWLSEQVGNIL